MTRNRVFLSRRDPVVCAWLTATALLLTVALVLLFLSLLQDAEIQVHANAAPQRQNLDKITPTSTTTSTAAPKRTKSGAVFPSDALLDRLAYCETGGTMNPATNTGNGFYGAYQFMVETWWSVGGEGYPHEHPYEVQREMARTLILQAGWGQFPACSQRLGLR